VLTIDLKYYDGRPVIDRIERVSRPGLRIYRGKNEIRAYGRWHVMCPPRGCDDR